MKNVFFEILDIEKCKQLAKIAEDKNELAILCPHYSINIAAKYNNGDQEDESLFWDWEDFEQKLGYTMEVSDYDDLVVNCLQDNYTDHLNQKEGIE